MHQHLETSPRRFSRVAGCDGKVGFESFALAARVAKRRKRGGKPCAMYRCGVCRLIHLGSRGGD